MDFFQLETFLAVAQTGSFSAAATQVHRTQPAVSQMVRKLEEEVGEPLFDRSTRDGMLTDAGRVLEEYAQKMLNLRREARASLEELRQFQRGTLAIAANEFTALYLLPRARRLPPLLPHDQDRRASLAGQLHRRSGSRPHGGAGRALFSSGRSAVAVDCRFFRSVDVCGPSRPSAGQGKEREHTPAGGRESLWRTTWSRLIA